MEPLTALNRALADLVAERDQLDQDIETLRRIIGRRGAPAGHDRPVVPAQTRNGSHAVAPKPGEAREAILALMADGKIWTPGEVAQARGTSPQAATRAFNRMLDEDEPPVRRIGKGHRYRIASKGDAQGSLPVGPGSDEALSYAAKAGGS